MAKGDLPKGSIALMLGIVLGRKGIPFLIHAIYITLIILAFTMGPCDMGNRIADAILPPSTSASK